MGNVGVGIEGRWNGGCELSDRAVQHTVFLKSYNDRNKTDLAGIIDVPTPRLEVDFVAIQGNFASSLKLPTHSRRR